MSLVFWLSVSVKESRSSIRGPDSAIRDNLSRKCAFLFSEFDRTHQLTRWSRSRKETSTKVKDKSFRLSESRFSKLFNHGIAARYMFLCLCLLLLLCFNLLSTVTWNLPTLLAIGGVERNPGPNGEELAFQIRSQNCRGLMNKSKLFKLLRGLYPLSRPGSMPSISCLQETHCLDGFILRHYFKGTAVVDNGERNQRGTCILIPDDFEVCSSHTSGIGRWAIAVIKSKDPTTRNKIVIVNIYGPNCHREAARFYHNLFESLDEVTQPMTQLNESFETVVVGDFNVVLDHHSGSSDRIGSRIERDLSKNIKAFLMDRDLFEPIPEVPNKSYTWRRGTCLSKLDYIFLSSALLARASPVTTSWHEFGANLDHATISVRIKSGRVTERGRSFPKLFKTDIWNQIIGMRIKTRLPKDDY